MADTCPYIIQEIRRSNPLVTYFQRGELVSSNTLVLVLGGIRMGYKNQ